MSATLRLLVATFLAIVGTADAQDGARTLYWRSVDVTAHLDADGRMRVRERQAMVFTGDWNGGERSFNIRPGQKIILHGITRMDANAAPRALARGDLSAVDRYDWTDGSTVRWRSRRPSDPAFEDEEIVYELDYTMSNILVEDGDQYRLAHDFAFPDRAGIIESYSLVFDADAVWRSTTPLPLRLQRANLAPGTSVNVTVPLEFTASGAPAGVQRRVSAFVRVLLMLLMFAGLGALLRRFFAEEKARGRQEPLTPMEDIDAAWLDQHIFSMPPEVVGAAWDTTTSAPEVAAMIARMVQEGKLSSRVEPKRWNPILHLELKVPRADLVAEERKLVNALFSDGKNTTDTERIKKRYSRSGFDPAALIKTGIQKQIDARSPSGSGKVDWRQVLRFMAAVMLIGSAAVLALILGAGSVAVFTPMVVGFFGVMALVQALQYRMDVANTRRYARRMVVTLLLAALPIIGLLLGFVAPLRLPVGLALIAMFFGITYLVLRAARTTESAQRLELRRTLAAGRAFFMRELAKPQPTLDDAWYPYLLAFGLGKHIDKWFRAFGGSAGSMASASGAAIAAGSAGSWSGGGPLFGGGGGFGGGGAGRSWAASVTSLSSGVSAPSSSGSSGGGGSSSSSGGGGGGGW